MSLLGSILAERGIVSIASPVPVSVVNGTAFGSLPLPLNVRVKYSDGYYDNAAITWSSTGYNSAVNALYTLTGTINGTHKTTTVDVWVLPAATQWLDLRDNTLHSHGIDNLDQIITGITGKNGSSATQTPTALLINRPSGNIEGVYFNTQGALVWGNTTSFNTWHSDTNWSVFVVWYQLAVGTTHFGPIMSSNGGASTAQGFSLFVDNRAASSRAYALNCVVTKAVVGQVPINHFSANNLITPNAWNWAEVKFDGTTFTMNVNGTSSTATPAIAFGSGNATNAMYVGHIPALTSLAGGNFYLAHIYMTNTHVTGATETLLQSWAAGVGVSVTPEPANVYWMWGQSNMAGRGLNTEIAAALNGAVGARIMVVKPTPPTQTNGTGSVDSESYWEETELGVNQTFESVGTQHGMEMRFGYEMWRQNKATWMIKMGVGGTPMISTVTYNDWNVSSAQLYTLYRSLIINALTEIVHVFRKDPIIRGMIIMEGETDSIITGAGSVFKSNMTTTINTLIETVVTAGFTINKMRLYIHRITDAGGFAYDPTEFPLVQAALEDIGDNYLADNPGKTGNVLSSVWVDTDAIDMEDAQHYSAAGQDVLGMALFNYFKRYTRE
jgi:hypothetical protein